WDRKIAPHVAPDGVNVVGGVAGGVGLDVDELDLEGGALNAVVAAFALFLAAGPAEEDFVGTAGANRFHSLFRDVRRKAVGVFLDERPQNTALLAAQLVGQDSLGGFGCRLRRAGGADLAGRLLGDGRFFLLIGSERSDEL